eukprot:SM000106S14004  [mRNA]  locus=s106:301340:307299:- [translate_table: standard]
MTGRGAAGRPGTSPARATSVTSAVPPSTTTVPPPEKRRTACTPSRSTARTSSSSQGFLADLAGPRGSGGGGGSSGSLWRDGAPVHPAAGSVAEAFLLPGAAFSYEELEVATDGFADANLLGQGGFGRVYGGVLPTGDHVAVKQLMVGGGQGEREFRSEVQTISRVHHRNLVSLLGSCVTGAHRMLVYEFVPNGTIDEHLHGRGGKPPLGWWTRLNIAITAARGLAYLHEDCYPRIIHRDIKASNILLDDKFDAKVADFGLARIADDRFTHVTTRVMGTLGYLDPEYATTGKLTSASDVYSFGIVLLGLLTGRKPIDHSQPFGSQNVAEWARPLLNWDDVDALVDRSFEGPPDDSIVHRLMVASGMCVRENGKERPTMSQVVRILEGLDGRPPPPWHAAPASRDGSGVAETPPPNSESFGGYYFGGYSSSEYSRQLRGERPLAAVKLADGGGGGGGGDGGGVRGAGPPSSSSDDWRPWRQLPLLRGSARRTPDVLRESVASPNVPVPSNSSQGGDSYGVQLTDRRLGNGGGGGGSPAAKPPALPPRRSALPPVPADWSVMFEGRGMATPSPAVAALGGRLNNRSDPWTAPLPPPRRGDSFIVSEDGHGYRPRPPHSR